MYTNVEINVLINTSLYLHISCISKWQYLAERPFCKAKLYFKMYLYLIKIDMKGNKNNYISVWNSVSLVNIADNPCDILWMSIDSKPNKLQRVNDTNITWVTLVLSSKRHWSRRRSIFSLGRTKNSLLYNSYYWINISKNGSSTR